MAFICKFRNFRNSRQTDIHTCLKHSHFLLRCLSIFESMRKPKENFDMQKTMRASRPSTKKSGEIKYKFFLLPKKDKK